ncbi:MAG: hypothetical protein JWN78_2046, partial [Bacteroidota bacterium]|nr:hypothetical protein [Bacteroidota bacterium]
KEEKENTKNANIKIAVTIPKNLFLCKRKVSSFAGDMSLLSLNRIAGIYGKGIF